MKDSKSNFRKAMRHLLLGSALTFVIPGIAHAQSADPSADKPDGGLDEIVVTAQKRSENIQDVPVAVTAVREERLTVLSSGGADIKFLSGQVPSLLAESSLGRTYPRFYIRGLGNIDFDANSSQPVSLIYDGVVLESPNLKGIPAFDLDRIEILRGPQGTLFGRNTPAGVIKFESRRPTQDFDGFARVGYGTHNQFNLEAAAGGALIEDKLAVRASVLYQRQSDWVDNTFTGQANDLNGYEDRAARLQFLWTPTEDFSALLNVHGRRYDGSATLFRANIIKPGTRGELVDGFDRSKVAFDGLNQQSLDETGGILTLEYDFGTTSLTSITSYENVKQFSRGDIDGGFGAAFLGAGNFGPGFIPFPAESGGANKVDQFTQEIRIASDNGPGFNYQAGFFYFWEKLRGEDINYDTLAPGNPRNGFAIQGQNTNAWGIFASFSQDLSDNIKATAGIRYSHDEKRWFAERIIGPFGLPTASFAENTSDGDVSWDVSLNYEASPDNNLYLRVARGYRAPSIQGRILFGDVTSVADAETVTSYEIGSKNELFDRRARFNLSAYYYNMKGQQLTAVGGTSNITRLLNADKTIGYGAEAELELALTDNFTANASVSYNFTELKSPGLAVSPCGGGCTMLDPQIGATGLYNIDGNRLPQAPRWIANWSLRYGIPVGNGGEFYATTDWAYRSKVQFGLYESVEFQDTEQLEGGIRVGYGNKDMGLDVAVFGRNITNDTSLAGVIDFNNLTGYVNEGRTWGIEVTKRF